MRRRQGESEEERRRMMEASPLHATAVSPRQKAVCIIMGCHLISSKRGRTGGGGGLGEEGRSSSARGHGDGEVIGVQSLAQIVFYRLSHLALGSQRPEGD